MVGHPECWYPKHEEGVGGSMCIPRSNHLVCGKNVLEAACHIHLYLHFSSGDFKEILENT